MLKVKIIATDKLSGSLLKIGKNVLRLGTRFVKMGALAAAAISGISIKLASDMEKGLREIGTLMGGLTDVQMKSMSRELENLASKSGQAMDKLTKAKYDIVSAGFNKAAESAIVLNQSAILAVGGVTEVSTAADLLTTTLNAYNKSAEDAAGVSDTLFTIVRLGKTTMTELGGSLGRLLAITGQFDISLEEVGAALATLTAGGQSTEEATTAIRASIIELLKPQDALKKLIKDTSFETTDALLASEGYAGALSFIKQEADKAKIPMKDLFSNVRSMQAVLPLAGGAAQTFSDNLIEMGNSAGASEEAFDEMQLSFDTTVAKLRQNVNNMLRSLGRELIAKLQPKIDNFNTKMEEMGELNWEKLANILMSQWSKILLAMGQLIIAGGQFIGKSLIDSIIKGIDEKIPKLSNTVALLTAIMVSMIGALGMPETVTKGLLKIIERVSDLELTGDDATTALEDLKAELELISSELSSIIAPAFQKTKEIIEEINEVLDDAPDTTGIANAADEAKTKWQEFFDWYNTEKGQEFVDKATQITNAVGQVYDNFLNMRKAQIQSELDEQINAVLASTLSEEEKQAKIDNLREQAAQKEKEAAKKLKPIKIAQAISNTALAVTSALGSQPWSIFNIALAALVGAAGAAEIATIQAQSYARGGFVKAGSSTPSSDTIPAMLSPHEIVSTSAASERFGSEIQRLNQIAESGGLGGGGGGNFVIQAIDTKSFYEAIKQNPNRFAEAVQLLKSERYL